MPSKRTLKADLKAARASEEAIGRSSADAPEIDGVVHIKRSLVPGKKLAVGEFADVKVTAADAHDLWATVV